MKNKEKTSPGLTNKQGDALLSIARQTIMESLGIKDPNLNNEKIEEILKDEIFQTNSGTFVTLHLNGQLRGCMGTLMASETIKDGVKRNAINAAFHDPRFPGVKKDELKSIDMEISILTKPAPMVYKDGQDLIDNLRVNIDGVILQKGRAGATFLPQVWEQLPSPEDFLSHLCLKAGLPHDAWNSPGIEILTYQVQYFNE
ncbi:MAG TPA: AmmeMemoRadiSam system protein A [Desulfobacteraceae bacterium]|nr:AmmeMemoRadiSam system protein A [Desulfobacteraceae bacterium]